MISSDSDTWIAYYMMLNHGRFPSEVNALSRRERLMLVAFAQKEIKGRPKS